MSESELKFIEKCEESLPKYIMVKDKKYMIIYNKLMSFNTYEIGYFGYNGNKVNWDEKFLNLTYDVVDCIPDKPKKTLFNIIDPTIYVNSIDDVISDYITKLNKFKYEKLDEIITKETSFYRELTSLLNRYCKENKSNTPDFILSSYMINCLRTFNHAINEREKFYGRENNANNVTLDNIEINNE